MMGLYGYSVIQFKIMLEDLGKKILNILKREVISAILFLIIIQFGQVGAHDLSFSHLTTENGLSNNTVHCIYQDTKGFLWFGTEDGLNMYNGYEFKIFKNNTQNSSSLSGNYVYGMLEDSKGRLWIAGNAGIDIFNRESISFEHIPFIDADTLPFYQSYIRAIIEDEKGNVIIANTRGVFVYDSLKNIFVRFLKDIPGFGAREQEGIRALLIDRNQRIWIGSLSYGLYAYDLNKKEVIADKNLKGGVNINEMIYSIKEDINGDIWIGTDNGIYVVKSDLSSVSRIVNSRGLNSNKIRKIYIENENRIWVGTNDGGLFLYNKAKDSFSCYEANAFDKYSINSNSIRSIFIDRQEVLWLGTYQHGVNFTPLKNGLRFKHINNEKANFNSLSHDAVSSVFEDTRGDMWIGTDGGGLDYYKVKTKTFLHYKHIPGNPGTIGGNSIMSIAEDGEGDIWIGGYLFGINVIDKVSGKIREYRNDPDNLNSLSNEDVRDILILNDTTVWIATNGGGVNKLNPETKRFIHFREGEDNALVNDWCLKLFMDSKGYLWIGTYNGLSIYNPESDTFKNYSQNHNFGGLSNSWVYNFAEDKAGNVWVGTANGLNLFNRENGLFTTVRSSEGLPSEVINGILLDNNENLWISTNSGISKFNPLDTTFRNYDVFDGLQGNQFTQGSCFKTRAGEMYFGGLNGLNYFYPDSIHDNLYIPEVYLTDFLLFFEQADVSTPGSPLSKSITESDEIILNHKQSVITFKYAALNYLNPEKNQYKYILEGSEKEWNNVGNRREATYTNLRPGKYTFKVKASNNDGIWNENATSIRVTVLPPWWETLFFKILIIILIISLIVGYYFYRINTLKLGQIRLEKLVDSRTREIKSKNTALAKQTDELSETNTLLEERQQVIEEQTEELRSQKEELIIVNDNLEELNKTKDKFFSIIAHDLKNPFNTILGFAELLDKNYNRLSEEKRRSFSKAIHDSADNVYNLLENLLQWARSQTNGLMFDPVSLNMNELIEENIELLKEMYRKKNITINFAPLETFEAFADGNMINTVIRNLLTNAVKFTNTQGEVSIKLSKEDNKILLTVSDNGIGISEEDKKKLFRIDGHFLREGTGGELGTGLGLLLCKEYVELNNGRICLDSKVAEGSIFRIAIPANS